MAHVYGGSPLAMVLRGMAAHATNDLPSAALWLRMALDVPGDATPQRVAWQELMHNITMQLPVDAAAALQHGGAQGLRAYIAASVLPPCLRPAKEEFAHYKQWMKARIVEVLKEQATPAVVDGLLTLDAVDLDLMLQAGESGDDRALQKRVDALHSAPAAPVLELEWDEARALRVGGRQHLLME